MPAPVPVGMLRLAMELWNPSSSYDTLGQATENYTKTTTLWCHVEQAQVSEVIDDKGVTARADYRILASWHPDVTVRSRLIWVENSVTRTFYVRGCWDRDQRHRTLEIDAVEMAP